MNPTETKSGKGGLRSPAGGRPPRKVNAQQRSINLSGDVWAWVDAQVAKGKSRNDVIEEHLRQKMQNPTP